MSTYTAFHRRLQCWYDAHGRKTLPWRNTRDPYAIYVSEMMLQQTQVKTVLERYYFPFLERFPTLKALAASQSKEVLAAWQGLGYYNRALHMHKAAKLCKGALPQSVDALQALPGIGRNTAHALASFAWHQPVPVMEANVKRVLCRIFALKTPSDAELWENAELLLNTKAPFDYNQAMMDIGAMVCTKRAPDCAECPASAICLGKDAPEQYPMPKQKKAVKVRKKHIVLFQTRDGRYYTSPRTSRFLQGLYHFVEVAQPADLVAFQGKSYALKNATKLGDVRQQYSHFTLEAEVWLMQIASKNSNSFYRLSELQQLPFSNAEHKILALLKHAPSANGSQL